MTGVVLASVVTLAVIVVAVCCAVRDATFVRAQLQAREWWRLTGRTDRSWRGGWAWEGGGAWETGPAARTRRAEEQRAVLPEPDDPVLAGVPADGSMPGSPRGDVQATRADLVEEPASGDADREQRAQPTRDLGGMGVVTPFRSPARRAR